MTEFVGRAGALRVYSYPETPRRVNPLTAFARNFATGPKNETTIADVEVRIPWNAIDALATSTRLRLQPEGSPSLSWVTLQGCSPTEIN